MKRATARVLTWKQQKARDDEYRRDQDALARSGPPADGLEPLDDPRDDLVGWAIFDPGGSAMGDQHVCRECFPASPGPAFEAVHRMRLAARARCRWCQQVLETGPRPTVEKEEK